MKNHKKNRKGLTLIELTVVLAVLIATAGLLIPTLANMLTRAHTATCSTNIGEVAKALEEYQLLYSCYPNNLDSLVDGSGTMITYLANGSALPASQGGPGTNPGGGQFAQIPMSSTISTALANAGITSVQTMATTPNDPTFDYYSSTTTAGSAVAVASATNLVSLNVTSSNTTALVQKLNLSTTGTYIALGIGPRCSMIGKTMLSAPVHFGDTPVLNPEYGYQRLVGIFEVADTTVSTFNTAVLVAVGPIHDDGLGNIDDELQNWYQLQQQ
jgi:type II secretory pathway pseudopilin PulG